MEVSSFVLLYFGTKIFVRCSEVSVVQRCPLMEVPLSVTKTLFTPVPVKPLIDKKSVMGQRLFRPFLLNSKDSFM